MPRSFRRQLSRAMANLTHPIEAGIKDARVWVPTRPVPKVPNTKSARVYTQLREKVDGRLQGTER